MGTTGGRRRLRRTLDETDVLIIEALNQDGRRSFAALARRPRSERSHGPISVRNASPGEAWSRWWCWPTRSPRPGLRRGGIKIRGGTVTSVVTELQKVPEIDYIAVCAGSFDLLVEIVCVDNEHMLQVLEERIRPVDGVDAVETFTILDVPKHSYRWTRLLASNVSFPE
jgi:Lrp/AsnC family transcriptional regulator for asnA, asnC and gidA